MDTCIATPCKTTGGCKTKGLQSRRLLLFEQSNFTRVKPSTDANLQAALGTTWKSHYCGGKQEILKFKT